jgi:hypothetical protein
MLPHLFAVFSQADRRLDRSHGGQGLAHVKGMVELHGHVSRPVALVLDEELSLSLIFRSRPNSG